MEDHVERMGQMYITIWSRDLLGRYVRVVDHLAVRDVAQGAPLGGASTILSNYT
jgi:hypothetical protein